MVAGLIKSELKNLKNPLYRNSIYISLSSMMTAVAGFLFWNVAARLYPSEDVGVASALVSAINFVFMVSLLGLNFSLIRFYPEYKERAAGSAFILTLGASFVVSLLYVLVVVRSESFRGVFSTEFLLLFVLFSMAGTAYNILSTYAIAKRKAEHSFAQSVLFSLRFLFLFVLVSFGVLGIMTAFGLGLTLGVLYGFIFIDDIKPKLDFEFLRESFKFSLGNYIANIANLAPTYIMPTIVLITVGKEDAAYFYIAFAVGNLILLIPNAINMALFVEGSHGLKDLKKTLRKVLTIVYAYLVMSSMFVWFFGKFILRLFGDEYISGLNLLIVIVLSSFFVVVVNIYCTLLNILKRVTERVIIYLLKAILFLTFSYVLILKFGIVGVGYAWITTYGLILIFLVVVIRKFEWPSFS
ncbi:lipopolysaccharide biosynthesis protein [Thermococcus sp. CX2]|uniref:lipopolysaccharide biosynthesis protein n=1 Tax=Thermococcus sp. CX2 TaxID=163006 RepID=UPI00143BF73C|nr:lipopolysaccharide biosynthesis protein [Thermococcus sp. CX2]NJE86001.1 lipopolysaccharide biosynthesis protein [Thermococcus sp. CX2]